MAVNGDSDTATGMMCDLVIFNRYYYIQSYRIQQRTIGLTTVHAGTTKQIQILQTKIPVLERNEFDIHI